MAMEGETSGALLYFLFWAGLIFLMMRYGCGAHVMGRSGHERRDGNNNQNLRWIAPERDTDPVCGKSVQTINAKSSVFDGNVFYFCSRECREIFEAAPEQYVSGSEFSSRQLEAHHA